MRTPVLLLSLSLLLLWSCGTKRPAVETVRPVKITVAAGAGTLDKDFAGLATSDVVLNLAFKVPGQIADIGVRSGQRVPKGKFLIEVDPRDIRLQVDADRSAFNEASAQLSRMKRLLEHEAVSQQEYEATQTRYARAKQTYENSLDALKETKLYAPFDAVVEDVYTDYLMRVQAGEAVMRLVYPRTTTVKFTMPESGLAVLSQPTTRYSVSFDSYRGVKFNAVMREYAKTSTDASGFPVSLTLKGVDTTRYKISPGMSCIVSVESADPVPGAVSLPLTAVYAPSEGGTYVWIVDRNDQVERRTVKLGEIFGNDRVIIDSGVAPGDSVVTAGVYQLREGMKVRILK